MLQRWWCEQMWGSPTASCPVFGGYCMFISSQQRWGSRNRNSIWHGPRVMTDLRSSNFNRLCEVLKTGHFVLKNRARRIRSCLLELSERVWCAVVSYQCFCTSSPKCWSTYLEPCRYTEYSLLFCQGRNCLVTQNTACENLLYWLALFLNCLVFLVFLDVSFFLLKTVLLWRYEVMHSFVCILLLLIFSRVLWMTRCWCPKGLNGVPVAEKPAVVAPSAGCWWGKVYFCFWLYSPKF